MLKMRSASHATVRVIIAGGGVGGSTPSYSPDTLVHLSQFSRPWLFGQPWDDCRLALAWHAASLGRYVWLMPCYCHRSISVVIIRQLRAAVSTLANLRLCIHSYRGMWQLIDRLRRKKTCNLYAVGSFYRWRRRDGITPSCFPSVCACGLDAGVSDRTMWLLCWLLGGAGDGAVSTASRQRPARHGLPALMRRTHTSSFQRFNTFDIVSTPYFSDVCPTIWR